jgi:lactobin A/cerein 7B family class IIb bacteriocin
MIGNNELVQIKGGTSKIKFIGVVIAAVTTFVVGVIDGYFRPLGCNR